MPLVREKRDGAGYEKITADSLIGDLQSIQDSIPARAITPLREDKERVDKVRPDYYAPERAARASKPPPYPERKPTPPEEKKTPYPQRKPQGTQYADSAKPWEAEGGNFFDYKKGGAVDKYIQNAQDIAGQFMSKLPINNMAKGGRSGLAADMKTPSMPHKGGLLNSDGAGRTDILNRDVEAGSYVIPADVVSALGDGNTMAGAKVLDQMMGTKPVKPAPFMNVPQPNYTPPARQEAPVPIIAAGGEYVVSKEAIMEKFGSLDKGHDALDQFVKMVREKNVKKLGSLPGPRK